MTPTPQPQEAVIPSEGETLRVLLDNLVIAQSLSREIREQATDAARSYLYDLRHRPKPEAEAPVSEAVERDYPMEFEAWWADYRHRNRTLADYATKKVIAWDAFYHAARHPAPSPASAWKPGREKIARIIEPALWRTIDHVSSGPPYQPVSDETYRSVTADCFAKADAILALPTPPATEGAGE